MLDFWSESGPEAPEKGKIAESESALIFKLDLEKLSFGFFPLFCACKAPGTTSGLKFVSRWEWVDGHFF